MRKEPHLSNPLQVPIPWHLQKLMQRYSISTWKILQEKAMILEWDLLWKNQVHMEAIKSQNLQIQTIMVQFWSKSQDPMETRKRWRKYFSQPHHFQKTPMSLRMKLLISDWSKQFKPIAPTPKYRKS